MILDAGAFVAVERGNREVIAFVKRERAAGRDVVTHGGVVGQIWRGGGWQAGVGRKTASQRGGRAAGCEGLGKRAGLLLARGGRGAWMRLTPLLCAWQTMAMTSLRQILVTFGAWCRQQVCTSN